MKRAWEAGKNSLSLQGSTGLQRGVARRGGPNACPTVSERVLHGALACSSKTDVRERLEGLIAQGS
jgi:hypothetical protein